MQILGHAFILMDVLNVNYDQDDIHLNKRDAYSLIRQEIQTTYKGTLSPYHFKRMYFEFDKKNDMASYLSLSYQAMENVLQELDAVVKDESASLPCVISPQKVESFAKKSVINQQVSLASQVLKNPKADNAQHVSEIVELDDFDIEETEVTERQPLRRLKKSLLLPETSEEESKQDSRIETHEDNSQSNAKKNRGRLLGSKNNKKNPAANNVVQKRNVPTKKGEIP
jgi:hypothetical protein